MAKKTGAFARHIHLSIESTPRDPTIVVSIANPGRPLHASSRLIYSSVNHRLLFFHSYFIYILDMFCPGLSLVN